MSLFKKKKRVSLSQGCRDQQKSHEKQTFALESVCIRSFKEHSKSFFYKKS